MAGGDDRLSQLSDDLLRRVLHFAPLREAASATALSRRWRAPLWPSSGAVNLETGNKRHSYDNPRFFTLRDDFVTAAVAALDGSDAPVTRITLRLKSDLLEWAGGDFMAWHRDKVDNVVSRYTDLADVALSHPAARRVEELRIVAEDRSDYLYDRDQSQRGLYTVTMDSLQLETLRVLELTHCKGLLYQRQAAALVLPRLSSLRLSHCVQDLSSLQQFVDAAPTLAVVCLMFVLIDATDEEAKEATTRRLRCPAANVLVLDSCTFEEKKQCLDRSGRTYKKAVDVDVMEIDTPRALQKNKDPDRDLANFWIFARSFTNTKEMTLRVNYLEDIAVLSEARRVELLPAFRRLERLEVQVAHLTKVKVAAMTILNMLRCCPMLCVLRINLTTEHEGASNKKGIPDTRLPQKEIQIAALLGPSHFYQCLKSSLTRVALQFRPEKSDCLGVKLIKFFAENALVLKEMHIDDGDEKLCERMNSKTEKWNSKRRKLGATSFVV
ncbi:unnamed protein product [Alopecurus aequalis]